MDVHIIHVCCMIIMHTRLLLYITYRNGGRVSLDFLACGLTVCFDGLAVSFFSRCFFTLICSFCESNVHDGINSLITMAIIIIINTMSCNYL